MRPGISYTTPQVKMSVEFAIVSESHDVLVELLVGEDDENPFQLMCSCAHNFISEDAMVSKDSRGVLEGGRK